MTIESFDSIADKNSKVLILGTMPSKESLQAEQYYAHPNNLFWDIMFRVCISDWKPDEVVSVEYKVKTNLLLSNHIALWDVLKFCDREESSLDKYIRNQIHNDFKSFFQDHPKIKIVFFNGQKASKLLNDFQPEPAIFKDIVFKTLQSTSPTNKTNSFRILNEWFEIRKYIEIKCKQNKKQ